MDYTFTELFIVFLIYSIVGYIIEVIYCSYDYKKIVNRGFLFGPYLPIYGLGALVIMWALLRYSDDPIIVFVFGIIITSSIEYYTSYLLEKIFHNKWWDYSDRADSINGRICVGNMLGFGVGACCIIYVTPYVNDFIFGIEPNVLNTISIIMMILFVIDVIYSSIIAYALRSRIIVAEELKAEKIKMLPSMIEKTFRSKVSKFHMPSIRYFRVFPNLKSKYGEELDMIKKWIEKNKQESKKKK